MSHTPGPWIVEVSGRDGKLWKRGPKSMLMVVADGGGMPGLIVNQPPVVTSADIANANLIAAAPDMLEALRGVLANCDLRNAALSSVKRAIAKAEGKSK